MTDYLTLEEFKYTAEMTGFNFADNDMAQNITAASRAVNEYCGRRFFTGGTAETRYYTPNPYDPSCLEIDDLVTLGTFATADSGGTTYSTAWVANTDYVLYPLNAAADGYPYEEIRVNYPTTSLRFPCYQRSVSVTGQFGWPAVPAPVKSATNLLATRFLRRTREAAFGIVGLGVDNIAVRIPTSDPDVAMLLDPYVRGGYGVLIA